MPHVTYTNHPRVTIKHRPGGPVVVHDRRGSEQEVRSGRVKTVIAGLISLAFLGFLLFMSWRAGDLDGTDVLNAALAGVFLVEVIGYLIVFGRGRVEIRAIGNRLQIRAWPLDVNYGGSLELTQIERRTWTG